MAVAVATALMVSTVDASIFNGVDDAGERAVVVHRTTGPADPAAGGAMDLRVMRLVDDVMCP